MGVDENALKMFAERLESTEEGLEGNRDAALEAAEGIIKYTKGAEKLAEAFKDNEEALAKANEGSWEYYEALSEIHSAAEEMFGLDLSESYIIEHLDDLKKAAEGDEQAIKNLQSTMATDWASSFIEQVEDGESLIEEGVLFNADD